MEMFNVIVLNFFDSKVALLYIFTIFSRENFFDSTWIMPAEGDFYGSVQN